ncbi:MAG: dTDP-4-dehydrorhamnose 3,5-epimerase family protein [Pirellulales bacterium]|nr:dTDP-4-dehydrorhamnose 3,5-epimerase family protein [Pirellulales bacterium]
MNTAVGQELLHFVDGEIDGVTIEWLDSHVDHRGLLVELFRHDELHQNEWPVMAYLSQTKPGVVRGPHEHREQTDVFVFLGNGQWRVYLWDHRADSVTRGRRQRIDVEQDEWLRVVVPPGVVHAYQNVGSKPAWVFNGANRLYAGEGRKSPVDEIRHEDRPGSPYAID